MGMNDHFQSQLALIGDPHLKSSICDPLDSSKCDDMSSPTEVMEARRYHGFIYRTRYMGFDMPHSTHMSHD